MKTKINADFKNLITDSYLNDMAESHIECWKDRYFRMSKDKIKTDLEMNHDPSLEVERVADELERGLTDEECNLLVAKFNKKVVEIFYK